MSSELVGQKFNSFVVLRRDGTAKDGHSTWLCRCDCGTEKVISRNNLKHTKSCGCQRYKHNKTNTPVYHIWASMKQRCTNPNDKSYYLYGARGITICNKWKQFENFFNDMGERPTSKHQIERINNNRGYYQSNCKWATSEEQGSNKRNNHIINFRGKTQCIAAWSRDVGIHEQTLWQRIRLGWSTKKLLTTTPRKQNTKKR